MPRDEAFRQTVRNICDLYTRPLAPHERVLCVDEKTSLQPRTRTSSTRPARVPNEPVRLEHEYVRKGALNLFAAFDTRTGELTGILRPRKRQVEFIELLEAIDRSTPAEITLIHVICDNVSIHHGKLRPGVARRAPALSDALHAGALLVDEPDRAVVLDPSAQALPRTELR